MKLNYYPETDSLYIDLAERSSTESKEVSEGVVLDYDANGNLVGIDIDNASKIVDMQKPLLFLLPPVSPSVVGTIDEDLDGLTLIQKNFIGPDHQFIYFRKGEAENNVPVLAAIVGTLVAIYKVVKDYPKLRQGTQEILDDLKVLSRCLKAFLSKSESKERRTPDIREIASPNDPKITLTLEILRSIGGDVRYLPSDRSGKLRYFVNNKQYCIFVRRSEARFTGILGSDPRVIAGLKEAFESEWDQITPLQKNIHPLIPGLSEAQQWDNQGMSTS
jgi:uncharacterized protein YuzE